MPINDWITFGVTDKCNAYMRLHDAGKTWMGGLEYIAILNLNKGINGTKPVLILTVALRLFMIGMAHVA